MGEHRRKADGRRVLSTEFKRATVQRILTSEKTLAELSRELDISPSVIRNWMRFAEALRLTPRFTPRDASASHPTSRPGALLVVVVGPGRTGESSVARTRCRVCSAFWRNQPVLPLLGRSVAAIHRTSM